MNFKFLHAADLHLDSPLQGLAAKSAGLAERIEDASRRALDQLVDTAIAEECRFVVLAGDIFDGELRNIKTGLYFVSRMRRLSEVGIGVFIVLGNHDAANGFMDRLRFADNVHVFSKRKAESISLPDVGAVIHARSFPQEDVRENLARNYPAAEPGLFNIGVLHTACQGSEAYHAPYAPCSLAELVNHGYQYWALGHVHAAAVLSERPYVAYPGNLQGRHIRETGPKGAFLVTVEDKEVAGLEHRPLDVCRWSVLEIDISESVNRADLAARTREHLRRAIGEAAGRAIAVRVKFAGESPLSDVIALDLQGLREDVLAAAAAVSDDIWIERIAFAAKPSIAPEAIEAGAAGILSQAIIDLPPEALPANLELMLGELRDKLPAGARPDELLERLRAEAPQRALQAALSLIHGGPDAN
ncbi:MAG: metallophosphoesterase family protein [Acetobacteraceae bacterium]